MYTKSHFQNITVAKYSKYAYKQSTGKTQTSTKNKMDKLQQIHSCNK